jgi:hypothetical protein
MKILISYTFVFTIYFVFLWYFLLLRMRHRRFNEEYFDEWLECIFDSSKSLSGLSWRSRCGNHPTERFPPPQLIYSNIGVESLHCIILAITLMLLKPNEKRDEAFQSFVDYVTDWLLWHCGCASSIAVIDEENEARVMLEIHRRQMGHPRSGADHFGNLGRRLIELPNMTTDVRSNNVHDDNYDHDHKKSNNPVRDIENRHLSNEDVMGNMKEYHPLAQRLNEDINNGLNIIPSRNPNEATQDSNAKCLERRSGIPT